MPIADLIFTLVAFVLQGWIAIILVRKALHRRFPWFFVYTVYSVAIAIVRSVLLPGNHSLFVQVFWATEALYALLGLLAIYEAFQEVFRPFYTIWWFRLLLPLVALAMLGLGIAKWLKRPPIQAHEMAAIVISGEILVRYLQGGVFVLFLVLSRFFQVIVGRYSAGILDGFGIVVAGILAAAMLRSEFGTKLNSFFRFAPAVAYIVAAFVWLISFRGQGTQPQDELKSPDTEAVSLQHMRDEMRRHVEFVRRLWRS